MIKQLDKETYRIKVNTVHYDVKIIERPVVNGPSHYGISIINKSSLHSLWRALRFGWTYTYTRIARDFAEDQFVSSDWQGRLWFRDKSTAERFLYFLDRKYNPTPQDIKEFIDIKLWGNL